jgi:hypothetical protein
MALESEICQATSKGEQLLTNSLQNNKGKQQYLNT